ncbi:hypothetical protein [Vibrio hepatarius]|uniref:hypothetical protein n=1 Tax=Vibrio hepatarius TaxID=171383 RepID=UPI001C098B2E|nr:hypothetical protein [Vibrio hepatarius]MBU2898484.1 hypothetical protein [Vibrio hepatarius]
MNSITKKLEITPNDAKGLTVLDIPLGYSGMENGSPKGTYSVYALNQDRQAIEYRIHPKDNK